MIKYFIFFVIILLSSCKTYYNTDAYNHNVITDDIISSLNKLDLNNKIRINVAGYGIYAGKKQRVKGKLYLVSDDYFKANFYSTTLGIEIVRIEIFKDTITIVDKINKRFYKDKISNIKQFKSLKISGNDLIKLLMARNIKPIIKEQKRGNIFTIKNNNFYYTIEPNALGLIYKQSITNDQYSFAFNYSNYFKKYNLPEETNIKIRGFNGTFDIFYRITEITKDNNIDRIIVPKNYLKAL